MTNEPIVHPESPLRNSPSTLPALRARYLLIGSLIAAAVYKFFPLLLVPDLAGGSTTSVATRGAGAICLALSALLLFWRARGCRAFAQPGQWIVLVGLIQAIGLIPAQILAGAFSDVGPWSKNIEQWEVSDYLTLACVLAIYVGIEILPAVFWAWGARRVADSRPWRVCFVILSVGCVVRFASGLGGLFLADFINPIASVIVGMTTVIDIVVLVATLVAGTDDLFRRKRERLWTHWAGALLLLIAGAVNLIGRLNLP